MKIEKMAIQLGGFALAIVLGSFVGVALLGDLHIINPLEQTAFVIVTDFLVYLGVIKFAPTTKPGRGE